MNLEVNVAEEPRTFFVRVGSLRVGKLVAYGCLRSEGEPPKASFEGWRKLKDGETIPDSGPMVADGYVYVDTFETASQGVKRILAGYGFGWAVGKVQITYVAGLRA